MTNRAMARTVLKFYKEGKTPFIFEMPDGVKIEYNRAKEDLSGTVVNIGEDFYISLCYQSWIDIPKVIIILKKWGYDARQTSQNNLGIGRLAFAISY